MALLSLEQWESMSSGYRKIFWGILLLLFHINLGPIQLLPNFIGYLLISSGIGSFHKCRDSRGLKRASIVSGILIVESIIEFFTPFWGDSFHIPLPFTVLFMGVTSGLVLLLFYDVLTASSEILCQIDDHSFAAETDRCLRIFLVVDTLVSVAAVLLVLWPEMLLFWIAVIICGFILRLWLATVFSKLRRRYDHSLFYAENFHLTSDIPTDGELPK